MNRKWKAVFDANPAAVFTDTALFYFSDSPYATDADDFAMDGAALKEQFRDLVVAFAVAGTDMQIVHDDGANTLTFNWIGTAYTDAEARVAVESGVNNIGFDTTPTITPAEGDVWYDSDNKCLAVKNDEADSVLQVGQENWIRVFNDSGATIVNGSAVYVSGAHATEDRLEIDLAKADAIATSYSIGVATHDIEDQTYGYVVEFGYADGIDTTAFSPGDPLWVSAATAGELTNSEPTSPNLSVFVGFCVTSDASGRIFVGTRTSLNVREKLTAARTYYVRTDGSDSNTGLVDSAGGAFLTWQFAIDTAAGLDSSIYDVTIQWGSETPTKTFSLGSGLIAKTMVGSGSIILVGDETTPGNVVLDQNSNTPTDKDGIIYSDAVNTIYSIRGFTLTSSGTGGTRNGLRLSTSKVTWKNLVFGAGFGTQVRVLDNGIGECIGNYTISAGCAEHWSCAGGMIRGETGTITLTGTPAWTGAFAVSNGGNAFILSGSNTFSGAATGTRYTIMRGGIIVGGTETYLPGNAQGTFVQGGGCYATAPRGGMPFEQRHARITTSSVAALTAADITVTWAQPFANANYTIAPSVLQSDTAATLSLTLVRVVSQANASCVIQVFNQNATTAKTGTIHAIAMHD